MTPSGKAIRAERLRAKSAPALLRGSVVNDPRRCLARGIVHSMGRIVLILWCHRYRLRPAGRRFFDPVR
jgi:hypothetical protein